MFVGLGQAPMNISVIWFRFDRSHIFVDGATSPMKICGLYSSVTWLNWQIQGAQGWRVRPTYIYQSTFKIKSKISFSHHQWKCNISRLIFILELWWGLEFLKLKSKDFECYETMDIGHVWNRFSVANAPNDPIPTQLCTHMIPLNASFCLHL
jgi:hypothetical protein